MHREQSLAGAVYTKTYDDGTKEVYVTDTVLEKVPRDPSKPVADRQKNILDSLRRSRKTVYDVAVSNDWHWFGTMTFSASLVGDRSDADNIYNLVANEMHKMKRDKPEFRFIIVAEYHKDKKSLHFHGLFENLPEEEMEIFRKTKYGILYNWRRMNKMGYNSFDRVRNKNALGAYLTKYITKGLIRPKSYKPMYKLSRGLRRPIKGKYLVKNLFLPEVKRMLKVHSSETIILQSGIMYILGDCSRTDEELFGFLYSYLEPE